MRPSEAAGCESIRSAASSRSSRPCGGRHRMTVGIGLRPLARTSPTVWSHMRLCGLRGALAASGDADQWVLHDPRAWLGTAFHRVMARAGETAANAEAAWTDAIGEARAAAA